MTPKQTQLLGHIGAYLIIATFFILCIWVVVTAVRDLIR
jgi:hypothetical protein